MSNTSEVKSLIASGKLERAIEVLFTLREVQSDWETEKSLLSISGRFQNAKKARLSNTVSPEYHTRQLAGITESLLSLCSELSEDDNSNNSQSPQKAVITMEEHLAQVIKENKRRRQDIAGQAEAILSTYKEYTTKKQTVDGFDRSGRQLKAIQKDYDALLEKLSTEKVDDLESAIKKIKNLIEEPSPTKKNLKKAVAVAEGYGFENENVKAILSQSSPDRNARITVAEALESFLNRIEVK